MEAHSNQHMVMTCPALRQCNICVENSPSLDRIDNSKGYVPGNIAVISMRANMIKNNASLVELKAIVAYIEAT